jgi:hypothetical protein
VLKRERIRGERAAIEKHEYIGREVRETMRRSKGALPEDLPVEPHIKEVRKRLSPTRKLAKPKDQ